MAFDINAVKRRMLVKYPFFGSVVANINYKETKKIGMAGTDGLNIYYNPDSMQKLNLSQQTFIVAHEVCHIAFNHIIRSEGKKKRLWNIATDGVINQLLKKDGLEFIDNVVDIEEAINYNAEQLYEKLLKEEEEERKKQEEQQQQQQDQQSQDGQGQGDGQGEGQDSDENSQQQQQEGPNGEPSEPGDEKENPNSQGGNNGQNNQDNKNNQNNQNSQGNNGNGDQQDQNQSEQQSNGNGSGQGEDQESDSKDQQNGNNGSGNSNGNSNDQQSPNNEDVNSQNSSSDDYDGQHETDDDNVGHDTHSMWEDAVKKHKEEQEKSKSGESLLDKLFNRNKKERERNLQQAQEELEKLGEQEAFEKNQEDRKQQLEELKKALSQEASQAGSSTDSEIISINDIGVAKPIVDWRYVLREAINYDVDWSYKNATIEDGVIVANLEEQPMPETEIVLDTSGSINETLLKNFLRECKNILQHSRLKVGCFDTMFYGFHEIRTEDDIENMEFQGGGGTDFNAAVNAFSNRVENKIIFTDGEASMPRKEIDAIWMVFGSTRISPRGGRVIPITPEQLDRLRLYIEKPKQKVK